jgi:hypothetical protein
MENLNPPALKSICQYVYHGTLSAIWRTRNNETAMLSQPTRMSACQFVYCGIVSGICTSRTIEAQFSSRQP